MYSTCGLHPREMKTQRRFIEVLLICTLPNLIFYSYSKFDAQFPRVAFVKSLIFTLKDLRSLFTQCIATYSLAIFLLCYLLRIIFITKRRQLIKRLALKNKKFFIVLIGYLIFKTTICWKSFYCVAHNYTCCKN